ncbi:SERINC3 [Acrasis kona]|uniref:SERINC3 n=1 Tax=Acrasis kona TaxID=1008807 RepID=A0AAW2YSR1_9EUKA
MNDNNTIEAKTTTYHDDLSSTRTKIQHSILMCVTFAGSIFLMQTHQHWIWKFLPFIPYKSDFKTNIGIFRATFTLFVFYGLHALLSSPLMSFMRNPVRLMLHKRFFYVKVVLLMLLHYILSDLPLAILSWFATLCFLIGFTYMLVQVLLVIELGHKWSEAYIQDNRRESLITIMVLTIVFNVVSVIIFIYEYILFTGQDCTFNSTLIATTVLTCVLITILSYPDIIKEQSSLFQCSVVTLYCAYLSFDAMLGHPDDQCNAMAGRTSVTHVVLSCVFIILSLMHACYGLEEPSPTGGFDGEEEQEELDSFFTFNLLIMMCCTYMSMICTGWSSIETDNSGADFALGYDFGRSWKAVYIKTLFLAITPIGYLYTCIKSKHDDE